MLKQVKETMIKEKKEALKDREGIYGLRLKEFRRQNANIINEIVQIRRDIDTLSIQPEDE